MRQFLVDAFAAAAFRGGPACVVVPPFAAWPPDAWMQALAMENNQAETAYLRATEAPDRFDLRWFTPTGEAKLCGHATLATAHVLFAELGHTAESLCFDTLSGPLIVRRTGDDPSGLELAMDFPAYPCVALPAMPQLEAALGVRPVGLYGGPALIAVLDSETTVRSLKPAVKDLPFYDGTVFSEHHVIVTAPADAGQPYDAVSRLFAPDMGIDEDPATGSMHCILAPLYHQLTGAVRLRFYQAHPRRGADISTVLSGDRVTLLGRAVTVAEAVLRLEVPA